MRARTLKLWDSIHSWSSLACTLFLLILCVTGLPLIFSDELAPPPPAVAQSNAPLMPLERIIGIVHAQEPKAYVQFLFWDDTPDVIGVGIADKPQADLEDVRRVMFDLHSGARVAETPPPSGLLETIRDVHTSLLGGFAGEMVLAAVALLFLASLVSGIVLYAPFAQGRAFGDVRRSGNIPRWLDLHNVIGIVLTAWLLVVGATGLMNALEKPLFAAWQSDTMPALLAPYRGKPFPKKLSSVDDAMARVRKAAPGMTPTSIGFPYSPYGSPRHYLVWLKGGTHLTEHFFTIALVDASNGELTAVAPLPWYLRALEISRPLHFGDYGGLPLKIIWVLFDLGAIVVLVSGVYLWLARRRTVARVSPAAR
jgi:uncharacterized iron-regulated membrane protein